MSIKPTNIGPASRQSLSRGPQDMADRGGSKKPSTALIGSTMIPLKRADHPVAQQGIRVTGGQVTTHSTRVPLTRTECDPYGDISKTTPRSPIRGGKSR